MLNFGNMFLKNNKTKDKFNPKLYTYEQKLIIAKALANIPYNIDSFDISKTNFEISQLKFTDNYYINWKNYKVSDFLTNDMNDKEKRAILILLSFNNNGFIRQDAVSMLDKYDMSLPYIIFRLNDWVVEVKASAYVAFLSRIKIASDEEIVLSFPYFLRLLRTKRTINPNVFELFYDRVKNDKNGNIANMALRSKDIKTRKFYINIIIKEKELYKDILKTHLTYEKDPFLRNMIFEELLYTSFDKTSLCLHFLNDKYSINKANALYHLNKYNKTLAIDIAKTMLLNNGAIAREQARKVLNRNDIDIDLHKFYIEKLESNTLIAIKGIGEVGNVNDCDIIEKYLNSDILNIKKATMSTLMFLNPKKYANTIIDYLNSDTTSIVATSYNLTMKYKHFDFDKIYDTYNTTKLEYTKLKCANLLVQETKWNKLIYLLTFLNSELDSIQKIYNYKIKNWITEYNNSYVICSEEQKNKIIELVNINSDKLDKKTKREILFITK